VSRDAGTRTPSAWTQTRRANPYATSRCVETAGIEPATATLAGRARSLAVIPKIPVLAAAERGGAGPEYVRRFGRTDVSRF
jgi:hypothetical protein